MNEKRTITMALIAPTTFGKTTMIAMLSANPEALIRLSSGTEGRTKITTEYCFEAGMKPDCFKLEKKYISEKNYQNILDLLADKETETLKSYSQKEKNNFKEILGLNNPDAEILNKIKAILQDEQAYQKKEFDDLKNQIEDVIDHHLCKEYSIINGITALKTILCTNGIDRFICRVTLRIAPSERLKDFLEEKGINLIIRDTKGLFDLDEATLAYMADMMEKQQKNNTETGISLIDLGLEDLDAVLIGGSKALYNAGNIEKVEKFYGQLLVAALKSVPFFILVRDDNDDDYKATLFMLAYLGLAEPTSNGTYELKNDYFQDQIKIKYSIPTSGSLAKWSDDEMLKEKFPNIIPIFPSKESNFINLQNEVFLCIKSKIELIIDVFDKFTEALINLKSSEKFKLLNVNKIPFQDIIDNYIKSQIPYEYDVNTKRVYLTLKGKKYVAIRTRYSDSKWYGGRGNIINDISMCGILGPRGGITGTANRHTMLTLSYAYDVLSDLIDEMEIPDGISLVNEKGETVTLFQNMNIEKRNALIRMTFNKILLYDNIEERVTYQNSPLIERYFAKEQVERVREKFLGKSGAFILEMSIRLIVAQSCIKSSSVKLSEEEIWALLPPLEN